MTIPIDPTRIESSVSDLTQDLIKALRQNGPIPSELDKITFQANPRMPWGTIRLAHYGVEIDGIVQIAKVEYSPSLTTAIFHILTVTVGSDADRETVDADDLDVLFAKIDEVLEI